MITPDQARGFAWAIHTYVRSDWPAGYISEHMTKLAESASLGEVLHAAAHLAETEQTSGPSVISVKGPRLCAGLRKLGESRTDMPHLHQLCSECNQPKPVCDLSVASRDHEFTAREGEG